jgi:hypothetical protein
MTDYIGDTYQPFALGNQFKKLGYTTKAYHAWTYTYYNRDESHPSLGYEWIGYNKNGVKGYSGLETFTDKDGNKMKFPWVPSDHDTAKVTVNDLTITGTIYNVHFGDYREGKTNINVTELNNVNIVDCETFIMSGSWYTSVYACGTTTLNNCNVYGTKRSSLNYNENKPLYDMLCCNGNSVTTINGGKYGSIYGGNGARIVVYGAEVDVIYGQGFMNGKYQNWTQVGKDAKIKRLVAEVY